MAVNLTKGANVNLHKEAPGLSEVLVGLGWDARTTDGGDFDLDASALLVDSNRKVVSEQHFIFFNNLASPEGSVVHQGDNRTGDGDGDDEEIHIQLERVPAMVDTIVIAVTIYDSGQNFGQVRNAYVRVVNRADGKELVRYDLGEDFSTETALIFGELYRAGAEWKFRAVGQGYTSGLAGIARDFGVNV